MRITTITLMALFVMIMFMASACGPDAPPPEEMIETVEEAIETPFDEKEVEEVDRESTVTEDGDEVYEDEEYIDPDSVDDSITPDDTALQPDDSIASTIVNEDGTVTVIDETGTVQATTVSPAGEVETADPADGAQPGVISSGAANVADAAKAPKPTEKREIKSRGDVNIKDKVAIIKTNFGDMYVCFYEDVAPKHVRNFLYLAQKGFYKDVKFHRIIPGFMAQAGMARDDWTEVVPPMPLEIDPQLQIRHRRGSMAAARTQEPNSATSQFYIVFERGQAAAGLDGKYTVFGQMFKGFEALDKLAEVRLGVSQAGGRAERSVPLDDVYISDVVIEDAEPYLDEIKKWKYEED